MNDLPASFLRGLGAWSILAGFLFLAPWILNRLCKNAAVRHFAWLTAFVAVWLLPVIQIVPSMSQPGTQCDPSQTLAHFPHSHWILGVWLLGFVWTLLRACLGWREIHKWHAASLPFQDLPSRLAIRFGRAKLDKIRFRIATGENPVVPITWGIRRPVVLLPRCSRDWSASRLNAVLYHELGHIKRLDNFTQVFAVMTCAVHWFNPLFWFSARSMEAESEIAADDWAMLQGLKPSTYAAELVRLAAELSAPSARAFLAQTAMVKHFTLESRVRSIIDPCALRSPLRLASIARVLTMMALSFLLIRAMEPALAAQLGNETPAPDCIANPMN